MDNKDANMQVMIRADASTIIGSGHVMRCLTLADYLKFYGARVSFICRELPGNLIRYIVSKGYEVHKLPYSSCSSEGWLGVDYHTEIYETKKIISQEDIPDWLIVDHYAIEFQWERAMRQYVKRVMVIDDLANRMHDCDVLFDQNLYDYANIRYKDLVSNKCLVLLGPQYALLRSEFVYERAKLRIRDGVVRRILVSFGGSDPTNETVKVIKAINSLGVAKLSVDVVVGSANVNRESIKDICTKIKGFNYYCQISNMAEIMHSADLAIGGGGTTTWERCILGLPAVVISVADNQVEIAKACQKTEIIDYLGTSEAVSIDNIRTALEKLSKDPSICLNMGQKALKLVDGMGKERVLSIMQEVS